MYGIVSAPAIWQRKMENILQDIQGVSVFIDDIKITGPDETHLYRLEQVLLRLATANIRISEKQCEVFNDIVVYIIMVTKSTNAVFIKRLRKC